MSSSGLGGPDSLGLVDLAVLRSEVADYEEGAKSRGLELEAAQLPGPGPHGFVC